MSSSYALGGHFEAFVKRLVAEGRYGNKSEVVREGLRLLEHRERQLEAELEALKAGVRAGLDDLATGRVRDYGDERELAGEIKRRGRSRLAEEKSG